MGLSVYVHIPYCLQRCRYCDFATFEQSEILRPELYVDKVLSEIRAHGSFWPMSEISTLYFGGGTPSLIEPRLIVSICRELANAGFRYSDDLECTLEINPATLTEAKLLIYLEAGINRFSVGAQTFDDALLGLCGRKHTANDTRETLQLLKKYRLNYSFDLLFALPGQSLSQLELDLGEVKAFRPPHLSAYCLTVPQGHPMSLGRPPEEEQVLMFEMIEKELRDINLLKYEISNFALPGLESRHNMAYWSDSSYWGIGLSSHSYFKEFRPFGLRFWNAKSPVEYCRHVDKYLLNKDKSFIHNVPKDQQEGLQEHEAMTDFCHMFLRTQRGLSQMALSHKFPESRTGLIVSRLDRLEGRGLIERTHLDAENLAWRLTSPGQLLSNQVFAELTFMAADLS